LYTGTTWSSVPAKSPPAVTDGGYTNGIRFAGLLLFVDSCGLVFDSSDCQSWNSTGLEPWTTQGAVPGLGTPSGGYRRFNADLRYIYGSKALLYGGGSDPATGACFIDAWRSSDGLAWWQLPTPGLNRGCALTTAARGGSATSMFVASRGGGRGGAWYTTDGGSPGTWSLDSTTPGPVFEYIQSVDLSWSAPQGGGQGNQLFAVSAQAQYDAGHDNPPATTYSVSLDMQTWTELPAPWVPPCGEVMLLAPASYGLLTYLRAASPAAIVRGRLRRCGRPLSA
jgi:hypothetical protein